MWGKHLKRRGRWWHYYRTIPARYQAVDKRRQVCFTLHTSDISLAKQKAASISAQLEQEWETALQNGQALESQESAVRAQAAIATQSRHGFCAKPLERISDQELLDRLRVIFAGQVTPPERPALLGLVNEPALSLEAAFERFWEHIADEWRGLSHDQQRIKRNVYLRALANFERAVGQVGFHDLERQHALTFRRWWMDRVARENLKPQTANKDLHALRRLVAVNFDIEGVEKTNPFSRTRLKEEAQATRKPFETEQIQALLLPGALGDLPEEFQTLFRLLVNTGMRPVEAIGLELTDLHLEAAIPYVHVRANPIRQLKTPHSERQIPLLGVSLAAAEKLVKQGGWGKRAGKNMYATSIINRHLKISPVTMENGQSLYSLRHWFQDQLTKRDVVDRAQAQLMGHKFQRPKYGLGKDLAELRQIIEPFAL